MDANLERRDDGAMMLKAIILDDMVTAPMTEAQMARVKEIRDQLGVELSECETLPYHKEDIYELFKIAPYRWGDDENG